MELIFLIGTIVVGTVAFIYLDSRIRDIYKKLK